MKFAVCLDQSTLFFDKDKQLKFILSILIPKWKFILSRSKQTQKINSRFIDSRLSVTSDELDTFFVIQNGQSMMLLHQKTASLTVQAVCISWSVALIAQLVMGRTILLIWALNRLRVIKCMNEIDVKSGVFFLGCFIISAKKTFYVKNFVGFSGYEKTRLFICFQDLLTFT